MINDPNPPHRKKAFTLIELLVVIAIIAILASMILPVLATAKDKAAATQCRNNQHQMTIAMHMYADDQNDGMAFPGWDGGGTFADGKRYSGWLYTPTNGPFAPGGIPDPGPNLPNNFATHANDAYKTGQWFTYMPNPKAYLCPVDIKSRTYAMPGPLPGRNNRMSSYVMNGAVCGYGERDAFGAYHPYCKTINVWSPMCYLQWEPDENNLGPGNPGGFEFNDSANFPNDSEGIGRLHSHKGGCVVAVGGHVIFLSREEWRKDADAPQGVGPGPNGKSFTHWSPYQTQGW